jgi:hypothetical protein
VSTIPPGSMGSLPPGLLPVALQGLPLSDPPSHLMEAINASVAEAADALAAHPDKKAAVVGVVDTHGVNAAVLVRVADDWQIHGYVGKDWKGPLEAKLEVLGLF